MTDSEFEYEDVLEELLRRALAWESHVRVCVRDYDEITLFDSRQDSKDSKLKGSCVFEHLVCMGRTNASFIIYLVAHVADHDYVWRLCGSSGGWEPTDPEFSAYPMFRKLYWHEVPMAG